MRTGNLLTCQLLKKTLCCASVFMFRNSHTETNAVDIFKCPNPVSCSFNWTQLDALLLSSGVWRWRLRLHESWL